MLHAAVKNLGRLADEMVFVWDALPSCSLLMRARQKRAQPMMWTRLLWVTYYGQYNTFAEKLEKIDFRENTREGAPVCRWVKGETVLDVMPLDEKVLGFTNRWHEKALRQLRRAKS